MSEPSLEVFVTDSEVVADLLEGIAAMQAELDRMALFILSGIGRHPAGGA